MTRDADSTQPARSQIHMLGISQTPEMVSLKVNPGGCGMEGVRCRETVVREGFSHAAAGITDYILVGTTGDVR